MTLSADLAAALRQLSAMRLADRAIVWEQLDAAGQQLLLPLLDQPTPAALSLALQASFAEAQRGAVPPGMTPRAARALVLAVQANAADDDQVRRAPSRLLDRLLWPWRGAK